MDDFDFTIAKLTNWCRQYDKHFPDFVKKIHFPYFKNLERGSEIIFEFPLTVFVGQNGCGKSSALQALFGCPDGYSTGNFWFNTATDPIGDVSSDGLHPSFWFEYYNKDAKQDVQILKYRSKYDKGGRIIPDYWEPARPLPKYGMKTFQELPANPGKLKTRWKGLKRDVRYLDFRSELSAFDKYFYFGEPPTGTRAKSKQDYIRLHSKKLQEVFDGTQSIHTRKLRNGSIKNLNDPCIAFGGHELNAINFILGKNYSSAHLVKHSFYKSEGISIRFNSPRPNLDDLIYTEAFAGSGEMSVVTLVHAISQLSKPSLILLDEPEVSLHPGAQKRMLHYLINEVKERKHQIVLCSHSPALIENLPDLAIKLFAPMSDGYFKVYQRVSPKLAFSHIGQTVTDKVKILVEDDAAKQLLDSLIASKPHWASLFEVDFHLGGAKDIFKESVAFSRVNESKRFFFLDGDQRFSSHINVDEIPDAKIDEAILEFTAINASEYQFIANSGAGAKKQILEEKRQFLRFLSSHFFFFPGDDPEDTMILASSLENKPDWQNKDAAGYDSKEAIKKRVIEESGDRVDSRDFSAYRKRLIKRIDFNHENIQSLLSMLENIGTR